MPEPLAKVKPGDPWHPNAKAHNVFVDAAQWVDSQRHKIGGAGTGGKLWPADVILGKNATAVNLDRWNAIGFGDALIDPKNAPDGLASFQAGPAALALAALSLPWPATRPWGVLLEPLAVDAIGQVAAAGIVPARVKFDPAAWWYEFAAVGDVDGSGTPGLVAGAAGARILYPRFPQEGGAPTSPWNLAVPLWALVDLGAGGCASAQVRFILREELVVGGTARAEIITLDIDGTQIESGEMITVWDWACEFYGAANAGWGTAEHFPDTPDLAIVEGDVTYEIQRMTCPGFAGCPPVS
jgi:hypothetical protein